MHVGKDRYNRTKNGRTVSDFVKRMSVLGMMAALSTVLTVLGTVISVNTVFFTAAAAFLVGIAVVFYGMGAGTLFLCVSAALDFLVNPNKLHVFLYLALAIYILICEGSYQGMAALPSGRKKEWLHRLIRLCVFAVLYVLLVLFLPQLLVSDRLTGRPWFFPAMGAAGLVAWVVYDLAYLEAKKWIYTRFHTLFQ